MSEFIYIEINNTTYYFEFDVNEKNITLKPKNFLDDGTYLKKDFYLTTQTNSVILNLLKSFDIKILYKEEFLLNELNKFNNLHEKNLLKHLDQTNIISNEHFILNNYFETVEKYFTENYNFLNNPNFKNNLFEINKRLNYINENSLIISDELVTILVLLMNLVNSNNQRFILDFNYLYNTSNNEFKYRPTNIISNIELNNNFEINYKTITGKTSDELQGKLIEKFKDYYYNLFEKISNLYNKDIETEKSNLLNELLNYRLNMNEYIVSLNNVNPNVISLNVPLKIDFNNRLKNQELVDKVNLAYKFLLNLDIAFNNINTIIDDDTPILLLKRIFYAYICYRDFFVEINDLMINRKIKNYFIDNLQFDLEDLISNNLIKNNFYLSIDKQYPLNKNFILSEIKRTQKLDHFIIFHDSISNNILKKEYQTNVQVYYANFSNYKYYINLSEVQLHEILIFELYDFTIDDKTIIFKIDDKKLYFNLQNDLDIEEVHLLKILGKTELVDLTSYLNSKTISLDPFGVKRIVLKDNRQNLFINDSDFVFLLNDIISKYDLLFYSIDKNEKFEFLEVNITKLIDTYRLNDFNNNNYQKIVMNMIPKKINIGKITNKKISADDLADKLVAHLLYYYSKKELEIMLYKFFYSFNETYTIQEINESNLKNYILSKYLNLENNNKILLHMIM